MSEHKENEGSKETLTSILIEVLISEHNTRRESIMSVINDLRRKIGHESNGKNINDFDTIDEIDKNIMIEQFNDVMGSAIKNDSNIVKLIELVLKYDHDGSEYQIEKVKEYSTKLSNNELNIKFEDQ